MRTTIAALILAAGLAALAGSAALAGEQYVDDSGYAVSGFDVMSYFDRGRPVPGRAGITAEWNGATWAFASQASRDRFLADPAAYAPAYDGHCAFGVAHGGKVPGDPQRWRIIDGRLYLNLERSVAEMWERDIPGNIAAADANWPGIEDDPASTRPVPELAVGAAPVSN